MIQSGDNRERHTIPRWNSVYVSNVLGETSPIRKHVEQPQIINAEKEHLRELLLEWKLEKSLPLAMEILPIGKMTGEEDIVKEIREYALQRVKQIEHPPALLLEALDVRKEPEAPIDSRTNIARIKNSLTQSPRNALDWCELARNYLILGQMKKSEHALMVALHLAPSHRGILRAVAQFYTHTGDLDRGLFYLRKSAVLLKDPWVLSSEIALSNEFGRTSKFVKIGQEMLGDCNINPAALSELASELGTMDFQDGNARRGRKKLEIAKKTLHENAMAQMIWINQRVYKIENISADITEPQYNYEAEAKQYIAGQDWKKAVKVIDLWQKYQPFSKTPAMDGSFIAADFLNDYESSIKMLKTAMVSNPNDPGLINNYAYTQALAGNLEKSFKKLSGVVRPTIETANDVALNATMGLCCYRSGRCEEGRRYYENAIAQAHKIGQHLLAYRAMLYFAREEYRIGHDISEQIEILLDSKNKSYFIPHQSLIEKFGFGISFFN